MRTPTVLNQAMYIAENLVDDRLWEVRMGHQLDELYEAVLAGISKRATCAEYNEVARYYQRLHIEG